MIGVFWLLPIPVIAWLGNFQPAEERATGGAILFGWLGVLFRAGRLPRDAGSAQSIGVLLGVIGTAAAIGVTAYSYSQRTSSGPSPDTVASAIGADYCDASGYAIIIRATNAREPIYDCQLNGNTICVTDTNGVANDQTATVRLLFADTLGSGKPTCIA